MEQLIYEAKNGIKTQKQGNILLIMVDLLWISHFYFAVKNTAPEVIKNGELHGRFLNGVMEFALDSALQKALQITA